MLPGDYYTNNSPVATHALMELRKSIVVALNIVKFIIILVN